MVDLFQVEAVDGRQQTLYWKIYLFPFHAI